MSLFSHARSTGAPGIADPVIDRSATRWPESTPFTRPREATADVVGPVDEHLVSLVAPSTFAAEQYRVLRHAVERERRTAGRVVVAVSSPAAGDGKTTTAINLAGALAQSPEARVLLIEADLRRPTLQERLGLGAERVPGLVDAILSPTLALEDVSRRMPAYNLSVVLAGQTPASPYEVLESPRFGELLDEARRRYDHVVLDTPPLVSFPDGRAIGQWVDGFVLVVAAHRTPRALVEEALDLMDPAKAMGLVFTRDDRFRAMARSYYAPAGRAPRS